MYKKQKINEKEKKTDERKEGRMLKKKLIEKNN